MTKQDAKELYDHYDGLVSELKKAQIALISGGVKSYTIGDRELTKLDLKTISAELENAIKKRSEYKTLMEGGSARKMIGLIPRDW